MADQTEQERNAIIKRWVDFYAYQVSPHLDLDAAENGRLISEYIRDHENGVWSIDAISRAVLDSRVGSVLKYTRATITAEEKRKIAEQQAKQAKEAATEALINDWVKNECPSGLLSANGEPYQADVDRIIAFIQKNYKGEITGEALNAAVVTLSNVLTWFDRSPEAMALRNQPPPPPRRLSEQAQLDAGLKQAKLKGHEDDGKMLSMQQVAKRAKEAFEKLNGIPSEEAMWEVKANQISVTSRANGKLDHGKTSEIRKSFARRSDGSISWRKTFELRDRLAGEIERRRNKG